MSNKKKVLLIIDNKLSLAPRAQTMVRALKDFCDITVAATDKDDEGGYGYIKIEPSIAKRQNFHFNYPTLLRKLVSLYLQTYNRLKIIWPSYYYEKIIQTQGYKHNYQLLSKEKYDVVICHHATNLPLAAKLANAYQATLFFNAHEYYPKEFENDIHWVRGTQPMVKYICEKYLPAVKKIITVSDGLADAYKEDYKKDSIIVPCVKPYAELEPSVVSNNKIRIVHQGYANEDRKIETMINACDYLDDRFELHLYLMPTNPDYYNKLIESIYQRKNIILHDSVSYDKLLPELNQYDIGMYILEPTNFNTRHMLPNKLYEFIQARLMVAISPSVEMMKVVEQYGIGIVTEDHTAKSMANALNALTAHDIVRYKKNTGYAAEKEAAEAYYPIIRNAILADC
ncbi:hypothetical protein CAP35_02600 [Chitinophagaceae bacterium IBVUCB1]|nr:hypothetical protein CAP35_02600 [Chitinophagaceae bacterium IBVUCB1]